MAELNPRDELELRRKLTTGLDPRSELEARRQLSSVETEIPSLPEEKKGFLDRVSERFDERSAELTETMESYSKGDIGKTQAGLQVVGKGAAGGALDVMSEGLVSAGRGLSAIIPDSIEEPIKNKVIEAWDAVSNTDFGKDFGTVVKYTAEKWDGFKSENPNAAKTIESVANIAIVFAPTKARVNAEPTKIGALATKIKGTAEKQIANRKQSYVDDLVRPKSTAKVRADEALRSTEEGIGPFKHNVVTLNKTEKEIAEEVNKIKGVSQKNSIQKNLTIIQKENIRLAKKLESDISKGRRIFIPESESSLMIDNAIAKMIKDTPTITKGVESVADTVAAKAKKIIAANSSTPSGMLKARKEFDAWVRTLPSGEAKLAVDASATTQSVAVKTVRNAMNDIINSKVHTTAVKNELTRQSKLFEAIDTIKVKAGDEANWAIARAWENAARALPIKSRLIQDAALAFGIGGLGAAAMFAPYVSSAMGITAFTYGAYKLVISPSMKKGVAAVIKGIDRALLTSKNPSMIKQLRADRALIVEALKNAEITNEPENK